MILKPKPGKQSAKNNYYTGIACDIKNVTKTSRRPKRWPFLYKFLPTNKKIKILDIGCGTGNLLLNLYQHGYHHLTGIEYNPKAYQSTQFPPKLKVIQANAEKLPLKNNSFDLAICHQVLEHLPFPQKAIKQARRVIKKNGSYIIAIPNGHHLNDQLIRLIQKLYYHRHDHLQSFSLNQIKQLLTKNGFNIIKVKKTYGSLQFLLDPRLSKNTPLLKPLFKIIYRLVKKIYWQPISYQIATTKQ